MASNVGNSGGSSSVGRGGRAYGGQVDESRFGTLAQKFSLAVGATFLLVGILGFIPGITRNLGDIEFASHESEAELLGLFQVSVLHNIVHLLFGIAGLIAARRWANARLYLLAGGAIYLFLALYGAVIEKDSDANFVPVNRADDWLHLGLGIGMIGLGALATALDRKTADADV